MSKISTTDLARALFEVTEECDKKDLDKVLSNFVKLLVRLRFLSKEEEIYQKYCKIYDQAHNIQSAKIETKYELSQEHLLEFKKSLSEKLKVENLDVKQEINSLVLGGVKVKVDDLVFDFSLNAKLNQLKNYLIKNT